MKNKIIVLGLVAAMLAAPAAAFAQEENKAEGGAPITEAKKEAAYIQMTLTVKSVEEQEEGYYIITEDENKGEIHLTLTADANSIFNSNGEQADVKDITEGTVLTSFVNANKPAILIYPPRYTPDILIIENTEYAGTVLVDTFKKDDNFLVNNANTLAVILSDEVKIVDETGEAVKADELDGKDLAVFYTIATFSIPAQTVPEKIVVLNHTAAQQPNNAEPAQPGDPNDDAMNVTPQIDVTDQIVVNDKEIKVELIEVNGRHMLPVRPIAEALGLEVRWNEQVNAVSVGTVQMGVNFNVGKDSYNKARMTPFQLGQAPITVIFEETGVTYVPVEFFTTVLGAEIEVKDTQTFIRLN